MTAADPTTINRLYGRSSGHKLRASQTALVENLLPQIAVPEEGELTSLRLFGDVRPLHLEIGFGAGEHLAYRADPLPDHGFIGCQPFLNGLATASGRVRTRIPPMSASMGDALEALGGPTRASARLSAPSRPSAQRSAPHGHDG